MFLGTKINEAINPFICPPLTEFSANRTHLGNTTAKTPAEMHSPRCYAACFFKKASKRMFHVKQKSLLSNC